MPENWKSVEEFPEYEVSDLGNVRRVSPAPGTRTGRVLKPYIGKNKYPMVTLSRPGLTRYFTVHGLVAAAFIGPRPEKHDICHEDGNRQNNAAANLRYDTHRANMMDCVAHGTSLRGRGSSLTPAQVLSIRSRVANGESQTAIGNEVGVAVQTINGIVKRRNWAWI